MQNNPPESLQVSFFAKEREAAYQRIHKRSPDYGRLSYVFRA